MNFLPLVQEVWNKEGNGNAMWIIHQNLKALSNALNKWSRQQYGDIFLKAKEYEHKLKQAEMAWAQTNDGNDRQNFHELQANYLRYMKLEESILKQKTQLQWRMGSGDATGEAACTYFQNIFTETGGAIREDLLSCISSLITLEDNELLTKDPTLVEHKEVIFSMSPPSAVGPDGMNGNLSNFLNKIISKVIGSRLAHILPAIIFANQSGFVKGRSISENIMLAQEIVQGIKKPNIGSNVVIKFDTAKAYDRVSWGFTCIMLRRMDFNGFFHSTRGLRQGDPVAPSLFIIGAELLSRMLNNLSHDQFSMVSIWRTEVHRSII
ncbi:PREDICTED: uncharacterized protein LOC109227780 [Nicotiana attenuata]|uniref:uncharacterized protein LOC109227780 n=1 Tax=Nicotiana attenuata TaxID=49451 RepID=UPI000904F4E8|nr:PREDICTED: uncharacterized protein LOC109227780 [Nicotiana attenuata]